VKIALCLFKYFPFGGLQRDFMRIATEALHRGHTVDVFTMEWQGEKNPHLNIHIIPRKGLQNHTQNVNFAKNIQSAIKNYDLVLGFNKMPGLDVYYAADICYQAKVKKSRRLWQQWTPRYRTLTALENAIFAREQKTKILLISALQQQEFVECYDTQAERFHLLPPGISRDRIASSNAKEIRENTRQEFQIEKNDFLLLMVGSGFKTKGVDRTLKALAALPSQMQTRTKLFVIGQDNPNSYLKQAKKLRISSRCYFLGGRNDVPRFFLSADVLMHPAYHENTGTVLLEALAAGLPVLTTDVCGYANYIISAKAGVVLSSPFQQTVMDTTLKDMLLSDQRESWHANAIQFAKNADIYDLPKRAVDYLEVYAQGVS
jgi:UDP-glucose:(heptosyl)LPS alpha-1,3-glucosyltransferase